jgi:hypothetical protein
VINFIIALKEYKFHTNLKILLQFLLQISTLKIGSPHWKHSELFFENKSLIPALQQLLDSQILPPSQSVDESLPPIPAACNSSRNVYAEVL